jgi:hypothetical protein
MNMEASIRDLVFTVGRVGGPSLLREIKLAAARAARREGAITTYNSCIGGDIGCGPNPSPAQYRAVRVYKAVAVAVDEFIYGPVRAELSRD